MKKKKISIFLVFMLVLMQIMPTYAATATGSNAVVATFSDAVENIVETDTFNEELETDYDSMYENLLLYSSVPVASASDADYGIMLLSDGDSGYVLPDSYSAVTATVSLDQIEVEFRYTVADGTLRSLYCTCQEDGYFIFNKPDDFVDIYCVCIWLDDVTPATGQYLMTQSLTGKAGTAFGDTDWTVRDVFLWSRKKQDNVAAEVSSFALDFADFGGKFMSFANIALGRNIDWCLNVYFDSFDTSNFPFAGYCKISFEKLLDFEWDDLDSTAGSYTSTDAAIDTADNTNQIASNTASIDDTLKELIKHISDQLAALWDQMYNLMHVPQLANDDKNTGLITDSIEIQMENDNDNTDQVTTAIEDHGNFIIDGLKGLFIPSDEFFKAYFDDLYGFFGDRFGFLSFPLELLAMLVEVFVSSEPVDCVLTLPSFEIMGEPLLQETSFNLTDFLDENFGFLLEIIRFGTSVCLIGAFINLCGTKWNEVMRN